jgi:hypothetical protein
METRQQGGFVNEENKEPGEGSNWLRGCGIAVGIAALLFLFVVGACFMKFG